jgi:cytochrome c
VAGERDTPGPNLRGVVGRRAGTVKGYAFSPAMIEAGRKGLVWTRANLDALMADTERFLPDTTMSLPPLRDAAERKAIIEYLEKAR